MTETGQIKSVYFLGIGGIGMSALARWFNHSGVRVAGYDRTPSRLTEELIREGIPVHYNDLGKEVKSLTGTREDTLVVITPAVPSDHGEWSWFRKSGFPIVKRSKALGMICNPHRCIAVAGTHGKTTVSTMVATILKNSTQNCGAFLGGISKNFNSNLILPGPGNPWIVTEADEYDRSFLELEPDVAVITYMDADHLDIYGVYEEMEASFLRFSEKVKRGGSLLVNKELTPHFMPSAQQRIMTYSLSGEADFTTSGLALHPETSCYIFVIKTPGGTTPLIEMDYPGLHNVENAVAAAGTAFLAGASLDEIARGLEKYSGVRRRFDIRFKSSRTLFIDDYAHHPRELKALITSVRLLYPNRKIYGIFQPHLYSRTRDFAEEFAQSLDLMDGALLLPIYPAREKPIPGVTSGTILQFMTLENKQIAGKAEVPGWIRRNKPGVLLTMGAGDIELMTDEIVTLLEYETNR